MKNTTPIFVSFWNLLCFYHVATLSHSRFYLPFLTLINRKWPFNAKVTTELYKETLNRDWNHPHHHFLSGNSSSQWALDVLECLCSPVMFSACATPSSRVSSHPSPSTPSEPTTPLMKPLPRLQETPPPPCHNETYFLSPSWDRGPVWVTSPEARG